jgi:hypothetical protein
MRANHNTEVIIGTICLIVASFLHGQTTTPSPKEAPMPTHAAGPFEVKVVPVEDKSLEPGVGRMALDKQYHGDLEATGKGQMLTAGAPQKGGGGYVAMEKVTGTLNGRSGSFVLQHTGIMKANVPDMTISVVPESGTGQLEGIAGTMTITIAPGGKHSYAFAYTLPPHI